jgi:hypothetical protein
VLTDAEALLELKARTGKLTITPSTTFNIAQKLTQVTVLRANNATTTRIGGANASNLTSGPTLENLVVSGLDLDLNQAQTTSWS